MYPVYRPGNPNGETATWTVDTTLLAPDDRWTPIIGNTLKGVDRNGRECLQLPLVHATIVDEPQTETTGMGRWAACLRRFTRAFMTCDPAWGLCLH